MRVIYAIVKREFELLRDVNDDGIVVLCALCFASKEAFAEVLPEVFDWIKLALDKIHEKEVFKVALVFFLNPGLHFASQQELHSSFRAVRTDARPAFVDLSEPSGLQQRAQTQHL